MLLQKTQYIEWKEYSDKVEWLNMFMFQQKTRQESIYNSKGVGQ